MVKLRMAHASTHGARKPPGPKYHKGKHKETVLLNQSHIQPPIPFAMTHPNVTLNRCLYCSTTCFIFSLLFPSHFFFLATSCTKMWPARFMTATMITTMVLVSLYTNLPMAMLQMSGTCCTDVMATYNHKRVCVCAGGGLSFWFFVEIFERMCLIFSPVIPQSGCKAMSGKRERKKEILHGLRLVQAAMTEHYLYKQ